MNFSALQASPLFAKISADDIEKLCRCLHCQTAHASAGQHLWNAGDPVTSAALVMRGRIRAELIGETGVRRIAAIHREGGLIGDILMTEGRKSPVDIIAETDCELLLIPFEGILSGCSAACGCHSVLRQNLMQEIARKYWQQRARIACLEAPTLRQKILLFLHQHADEAGSRIFRLEFDREGMADYLCVNRSALCRELSAMKQDGLIDYYKESFKLL